jgi:hypothetical protein
MGKLDGKRPLGRRMRRWEDKIKMDLKEIGWEYMGWIHVAQERDRWRRVLLSV